MTDHVLIDRTRTRLIPDGSIEKGFQITREEAVKLGLLESSDKPKQARRAPAFDAAKAKVPPVQRRRSAKRK